MFYVFILFGTDCEVEKLKKIWKNPAKLKKLKNTQITKETEIYKSRETWHIWKVCNITS